MGERKVYHESATETAKKVRKALKEAFPEYPARHFKVTSQTYSGGSSVYVGWEDYPLVPEVDKIVGKFKSATFDGMQDLKEYTPYEYEGKLYSGADYISTSRAISKEREEVIEKYCAVKYGGWEGDTYSSYEKSRLMRVEDALLDKDLNYLGEDWVKEEMEKLKEGQAGEGNVLGENLDEIILDLEKKLDTIEVEGMSVSQWHQTRKDDLVEWLNSEMTRLKILKEYKKSNKLSLVDVAFYALRDIIKLKKNKVNKHYRYLSDKLVVDEMRERGYRINNRKEILTYFKEKVFTEKLNDEMDKEAMTYSGVGMEHELESKVRDIVKRGFESYKGETEVEEVAGEGVESLVQEMINHKRLPGVEGWHESRIAKTSEKLRREDTVRDIVEGLSESATIEQVKEHVDTKAVEIVKEERAGLVKYLGEIVNEEVTVKLDKLNLGSDLYGELKNKLEDELFTGEGWNRLIEGVLSVPLKKERKKVGEEIDKVITSSEVGKEGKVTGELTKEDLQEINTISKGVFGWLSKNGFVVNQKEIAKKTDLKRLQEIKETSKNSEELLLSYEVYLFENVEGSIIAKSLTEEERTIVKRVTKESMEQMLREGKKIDVKGIKTSVNIEKLENFKRVKYQSGSFEDDVKKYIKEVFEGLIVEETSATTAEPVQKANTEEVQVNGINIEELVKGLIKEIVTLTFIKADGTLRTMVATRDEKFAGEEIAQINQPEEIKKQIGKGTIPVWDMQKGAMRAFKVERLKSYTVGGETVEVSDTAPEVNEEMHFDPTKLSTEQLIKVLNKSVVRLVFKKKDGTDRVMWATREHNIIELYQDPGNPMTSKKKEDISTYNREEAITAQVNGDYVKVFDLTVNEFRTFKPTTLHRMDTAHNVASWVEFNPKQDGWYNCIYDGEPIGKYYEEGKRKAKSSPERENRKRVDGEKEQQRRIDEVNYTRESIARQVQQAEEQKEKVNGKVEERRKRWVETNKLVREALKTVGEYTEQDENVYQKMKTFVNNLNGKLKDLQVEGKGRGEITNVASQDAHRVVMFEYYDDAYILHPRFVINGISHRVFADRTGTIVFTEGVKDSEGDVEFRRELDQIASLVTGRRVSNAIYAKMEPTDIRRLKRLEVMGVKVQDKLRQEKIVIKLSGKDGLPPHAQVSVDGKKFIISPAVIHRLDDGKTIFKRDRHTSTLSELTESVRSAKQLGITEEAYTMLMKVLVFTFDLRKRIKDEEGNFV